MNADLEVIREDHEISAHLPSDDRDACPVCHALDRIEELLRKGGNA